MPTLTTADVHQLLTPATIRLGLPGTSKDAVLNALVDTLAGHAAVTSLEAVREAVFARERRMSTGVGKGLGLPHAKTPAATDTVGAFAVTAEAVPYDTVDDEPVRMLFLLVGPEHAKSRHIKLLGRISRLINRDALRRRLLDADTPEAVVDLLRKGEASLRR
jgi:PTS system fructose-specific IIA component